MKTIEFRFPRRRHLTRAAALIESVCSRRGLSVAMKGSLAGYPGCIHWHYKQPNQRGTLELTFYPAEKRLWASVQEGRKAPWIDVELPQLRRAIERELCAAPPGRARR